MEAWRAVASHFPLSLSTPSQRGARPVNRCNRIPEIYAPKNSRTAICLSVKRASVLILRARSLCFPRAILFLLLFLSTSLYLCSLCAPMIRTIYRTLSRTANISLNPFSSPALKRCNECSIMCLRFICFSLCSFRCVARHRPLLGSVESGSLTMLAAPSLPVVVRRAS